MFDRVAIVGLGLLGGSLALAIKEKGLAKHVVGIARRQETLAYAQAHHVVDYALFFEQASFHEMDLIILATPVSVILDYIVRFSHMALPKTLITDVGSTKTRIVRHAESHGLFFVGSHPMAGSEKGGIVHAQHTLFEGKHCFVTATNKTDRAGVSTLCHFWEALGSHTAIVSPEAHDRCVASMSHLPHIIAALLMHTVTEDTLPFAGEGLASATRIAGGLPGIWRDILMTNRENIVTALSDFQQYLAQCKDMLEQSNAASIFDMLAQAKQKRDAYLCQKPTE